MKIKWLGHSCFKLTLDNGKVFVTDPYDETVGYPPLRVRADAVLSTHDHFDHNHFAAVDGDPQIINAPGEYALFGAKVTAVPSWHDEVCGAKRGANLIFVIEADGLRVAHLGDLGHLPETEAQKAALTGLDAMLVPIGGFFTIDTPQAVEIIDRFKPRCAIAMHFKNKYCGFTISDSGEFIRLTGARTLPNEIELTADVPAGCCVMEI